MSSVHSVSGAPAGTLSAPARMGSRLAWKTRMTQVVAHGGAIAVVSNNGVTTFTIKLPRTHWDKLLTNL